MNTDDLIAALAQDTRPVSPHAIERGVLAALPAGLAVSAAVMLAWLGLRADFATAMYTPEFWLKLAYPLAVGVGALALGLKLVRPGVAPGARTWLAAAPFVVMALLGAAAFGAAPPETRAAVWLGGSWDLCPLFVLALSLPPFIALFAAFRRAAPTRPAWAGFVAGLAAGGFGAFVYALSCDETGVPFLATWYTLGMLLSGAIGGLLGRRLLKW
ncbi:MAG: DUF1109 domain-containing protein [Alphaproteobacteria bacterium]|nr:DUF1109 domain-containing protein [Alphaproteobacteria bacterium]